jgi:hypothetical protein
LKLPRPHHAGTPSAAAGRHVRFSDFPESQASPNIHNVKDPHRDSTSSAASSLNLSEILRHFPTPPQGSQAAPPTATHSVSLIKTVPCSCSGGTRGQTVLALCPTPLAISIPAPSSESTSSSCSERPMSILSPSPSFIYSRVGADGSSWSDKPMSEAETWIAHVTPPETYDTPPFSTTYQKHTPVLSEPLPNRVPSPSSMYPFNPGKAQATSVPPQQTQISAPLPPRWVAPSSLMTEKPCSGLTCLSQPAALNQRAPTTVGLRSLSCSPGLQAPELSCPARAPGSELRSRSKKTPTVRSSRPERCIPLTLSRCTSAASERLSTSDDSKTGTPSRRRAPEPRAKGNRGFVEARRGLEEPGRHECKDYTYILEEDENGTSWGRLQLRQGK